MASPKADFSRRLTQPVDSCLKLWIRSLVVVTGQQSSMVPDDGLQQEGELFLFLDCKLGNQRGINCRCNRQHLVKDALSFTRQRNRVRACILTGPAPREQAAFHQPAHDVGHC